MAEDHWHQARLIPTSGISGQDEAERRATSALLAVISAVREFGACIVRPLGAPGGPLSTYIEVPFKLGDKVLQPDGVIQTTRAGRQWTALVEVKTSDACLQRDQIESYLDVARDAGFDAVLTISNQIEAAPGMHPVEVDRRKLKRVALHHLSWAEVLTLAVQQRVHRGVTDPDQAWILAELIRYLEHPKSGALDFADMGPAWTVVRDAVATGTLRLNDKGLSEVIARWEQLLRFAALRMGRELGADVQVAWSRREQADASIRINERATSLVERGLLTGALRIPDAIGPLTIEADVHASKVTVSVDVDAPREGRAATRVNWLTRQLKDAPDSLRIEAWTMNARTSTSELLHVVRRDANVLIDDQNKELRSFRVSAISALGTKRGVGRGSLIDSVLSAIDGTYASVLQNLRPWTSRAPRLPAGTRSAAETAGIDLAPTPSDLADGDNARHHTGASESAVTPASGEDVSPTASVEFRTVDSLRDVPAPESDDEQLVEWVDAQDKLDRERDVDSSAGAQEVEGQPAL